MMGALMPALLIGFVASSISCMILAHRLSFLTVGVSHASLAGLGIAVTLSLPLLPTATVVAVLVALLLASMPKTEGISEDSGTGILFAGSMALGIVLLAKANSQDVDMLGLLFGNILTTSPQEHLWLLFIGTIIMISLILYARSWWSIAFDAVTAQAGGMPVAFLRLMLYAIVGLTVILCVKLAGIVLTTGLLILPAATAWFWGRSMLHIWLLSVIGSLTATMLGMMISYAYDWPSGATIVLSLCILFLISWSLSWLNQRVKIAKHHPL
ncbi:MAG: metal ABC transporter permease [Zetaproteobacteria bacterium]|nr:metal ABC transporter permease [Zetaproteobacteria bacterium]